MLDRAVTAPDGVMRATEEEMVWIVKAIIQDGRSWDSVLFYDKAGDVPRWSEPDWKAHRCPDPRLSVPKPERCFPFRWWEE
ncbi:hypothetical protein ACIBF5_00565 [Micromonospora sp. NPDC050417]|uniref:hypothetical protein n=1 Tax=Micromonospora sp. NPDC050417 TaxID=3364280 RepID=UPI003795ECC1